MAQPTHMRLRFQVSNCKFVSLIGSVDDGLECNIITGRAAEKLADFERTCEATSMRVSKLNGRDHVVRDWAKLVFQIQEAKTVHREVFYIEIEANEDPDQTIDVFLQPNSEAVRDMEKAGNYFAPIRSKVLSPEEEKSLRKKRDEADKKAAEELEKIRAQGAEASKPPPQKGT